MLYLLIHQLPLSTGHYTPRFPLSPLVVFPDMHPCTKSEIPPCSDDILVHLEALIFMFSSWSSHEVLVLEINQSIIIITATVLIHIMNVA